MARRKMTPEEKEQARIEREEYNAERSRKYPFIILSDFEESRKPMITAQIRIDGDKPLSIELVKIGEWARRKDRPEIEFATLDPSLEELLRFICVLVTYYNNSVTLMNQTAASIVIPQLLTVPQAEDIDRASPPQ